MKMSRKAKPPGYWDNKSRCQAAAKRFSSRAAFQKAESGAYLASKRNGWYEEICSHMESKIKPVGFWQVKDNCLKEAQKYTSRIEFNRQSPGAYDSAHRNGWLDSICIHMTSKFKKMGHWNVYDNCWKEAQKYSRRSDFHKKSPGAANGAIKNGWLEKICSHMDSPQLPKKYWQNLKRCQSEALKYNSRSEFRKNSSSAANAAKQNGWFEKICAHMPPVGSKFKRAIYAYEFADRSVYVGLTYNYSTRHLQHSTSKNDIGKRLRSESYKHIKHNNWLKLREAQKAENALIEQYKKDGWLIINKARAGGLGSNLGKWPYENCHKAALKCKSRKEFMTRFSTAYQMARRRGWLNKICSHMKTDRKVDGFWNKKENCLKEAKKYSLKSDFSKKAGAAYSSCLKNGWLAEACKHMKRVRKEKQHWTHLSNLKKEAKKFRTRSEFKTKSSYAYNSALRMGVIDEICGHMESPIKKHGFWNKFDECKKAALKYKSKMEFAKNEPGAYRSALRNGFLNEICLHMK